MHYTPHPKPSTPKTITCAVWVKLEGKTQPIALVFDSPRGQIKNCLEKRLNAYWNMQRPNSPLPKHKVVAVQEFKPDLVRDDPALLRDWLTASLERFRNGTV